MSRGILKIMEKLFSISKTAKMVNMTTETLRHYDRIGLVKPCKIDKWTNYRYYSEREIVLLNTVRALQYMNLTLQEIKEILKYNDFEKIIEFLNQAEKSADEKIIEITHAKEKIQRARLFYQSKLTKQQENVEIYVKTIPQRVILLSNHLETPSVDNLWNYHRHFYDQIGFENKDSFSFEDTAGVYTHQEKSQLFAICTQYTNIDGLTILPAGKYLCSNCTSENYEEVLEKLLHIANEQYDTIPQFTLRLVILSGILQWNYQIQLFLAKETIKESSL